MVHRGSIVALRVLLVAFGLLVGACRQEPPPDTPRALADRVVHAMNRHAIREYLGVFPSASELDSHLDCTGRPSLTIALARIREEAPATLDAWRSTGLRTAIVRFDEAAAETLMVSPGDIIRQCIVKRGFEIRRVPVVIRMTRGGRTEESSEVWPFWRFEPEGRWTYTRF
jgi:hypothetical protein